MYQNITLTLFTSNSYEIIYYYNYNFVTFKFVLNSIFCDISIELRNTGINTTFW